MILGMFFQLAPESEGQMAKEKKGGDRGKERKPSKKRGGSDYKDCSARFKPYTFES